MTIYLIQRLFAAWSHGLRHLDRDDLYFFLFYLLLFNFFNFFFYLCIFFFPLSHRCHPWETGIPRLDAL